VIAVQSHHITALTKRHAEYFSQLMNTTSIVIGDFLDVLVVSVLFDDVNTTVGIANVENHSLGF
jgi:hypothetical protein